MTQRSTTADPTPEQIADAIEILSMCAPITDIQGGLWFGNNHNFADATFRDYGACRAFAVAARAILAATPDEFTKGYRAGWYDATARAATPAVGGHVQRSELDDASNACLELCSKHGFATGHGDTVADMIREIDGQIAAQPASPSPAVSGEPVAWRVDGKREGLSQVWFYYKPEWPQIHAEHGDTVTPLYAAIAAAPAVGVESRTSPLTRHLRMIARDVDNSHWAESIASAADILENRAAQPASRVTGASDIVDEAACLIWSELCPDSVMGDDERPHYEAAAKAVLSAFPLRGRDEIARIIRETYESDLASINGDACFEYSAADTILSAAPPEQLDGEIKA